MAENTENKQPVFGELPSFWDDKHEQEHKERVEKQIGKYFNANIRWDKKEIMRQITTMCETPGGHRLLDAACALQSVTTFKNYSEAKEWFEQFGYDLPEPDLSPELHERFRGTFHDVKEEIYTIESLYDANLIPEEAREEADARLKFFKILDEAGVTTLPSHRQRRDAIQADPELLKIAEKASEQEGFPIPGVDVPEKTLYDYESEFEEKMKTPEGKAEIEEQYKGIEDYMPIDGPLYKDAARGINSQNPNGPAGEEEALGTVAPNNNSSLDEPEGDNENDISNDIADLSASDGESKGGKEKAKEPNAKTNEQKPQAPGAPMVGPSGIGTPDLFGFSSAIAGMYGFAKGSVVGAANFANDHLNPKRRSQIATEKLNHLADSKITQVSNAKNNVDELVDRVKNGTNKQGEPASDIEKSANFKSLDQGLRDLSNRMEEASEMISNPKIDVDKKKSLVDNIASTNETLQKVDELPEDSKEELIKRSKEVLEAIVKVLKQLFGKKEQESSPSM